MHRLKTWIAGTLAIAALALAAPVAPTVAHGGPEVVAAKSCDSGYTHAALPWGHKCLRAGQYCKRGENRHYHRYGFHCKSSGRLTYS